MAVGYVETIIDSQIDGGTLTSAAAASALPGAAKFTLPANYFSYIGKQIVVEAWGRLSTVATTPGTWRLDVRFGSIVVFDTLAGAFVTTNGYTTVGWYFKCTLTARAIGNGTTANLMGQGIFTSPNVLGGANVAMPIGGVVAMCPWNSAPAVGNGFDSTASQQIDFFWTQTAGTGSFTCHQFSVYGMN